MLQGIVKCLTVTLLAFGFCLAKDIDDGYLPIPNVEAKSGDPAAMQGYSLTEAAKLDNAVCLDGTPGLYYHRPGTGGGANKWYIHQEGGGWCSSVDACQERSLTNLGSSVHYTSTVSMNYGYFALDPEVNPLMYNWYVFPPESRHKFFCIL